MTDDTADPTGRRNTSMRGAVLWRLIARDLPFETLGAPA